MDWFLYDRDPLHEKVEIYLLMFFLPFSYPGTSHSYSFIVFSYRDPMGKKLNKKYQDEAKILRTFIKSTTFSERVA